MDATTIAVDLAKQSFEVAIETDRHTITHRRFGRVQFARFLRLQAPTQLVMEACATAHYWGRVAQRCGHRITLLSAQYVTPFVRRQKTDRTDVDALLAAYHHGGLPGVPVKTITPQEIASLHRVRQQWMTTRTARINGLRGLLAEFGVIVPAGVRRVRPATVTLLDQPDNGIPDRLRRVLRTLVGRTFGTWRRGSRPLSTNCTRSQTPTR